MMIKEIGEILGDHEERIEALEKLHPFIDDPRHDWTDRDVLPLGSDNSLEAYVEGRMESDPLGSDNDLPPMRLKCGAHGIVECPECLEAFKDACRVDPEGRENDQRR